MQTVEPRTVHMSVNGYKHVCHCPPPIRPRLTGTAVTPITERSKSTYGSSRFAVSESRSYVHRPYEHTNTHRCDFNHSQDRCERVRSGSSKATHNTSNFVDRVCVV